MAKPHVAAAPPIVLALDTNVLTALAKSDEVVEAKLRAWMDAHRGHQNVVVPRVAVYEFRRGVHLGTLAEDASHAFDQYLALYSVAEMDAGAWDEAARLWAEVAGNRRRRGEPRPARDHDILIAACALRYGYGIATREKRRLGGIRAVRPNLYVERW